MAKRNGFTLLEMLVVITMIGLLMAMLAGALMQARRRAQQSRAEAELRDLVTAWEKCYLYYLYSDNPAPNMPGLAWTEMDSAVLGSLTDVNAGLVWLNLSDSRLKGGKYMDPWGNPYEVKRNASTPGNNTVLTLKASVHFNNRLRE